MRDTDSISLYFNGRRSVVQLIMLIFGSDSKLTAWHVPVFEAQVTAVGFHLAAWASSGFGSKCLVAKHSAADLTEHMHATGRVLQFTVGAWGDCAGPETASRIHGPRGHATVGGIKPNWRAKDTLS